MLVVYRLTDVSSTNPSPIYQDNKFKLNELCLRSFVRAFMPIMPKVHFILDHCPLPAYEEMLTRLVPFQFTAELTAIGINGTALRSYDIAKESEEEVILFQECDYLYFPGTLQTFETAIDTLGLVSPYDHKNFYLDRSIHSEMQLIRLVDNHHFRTTERNTMTFGIRRDIFLKNFDTFYKYGYLDSDVWLDLFVKGDQLLWTPVPSFATHMALGWLAPAIDWKTEWEKYA